MTSPPPLFVLSLHTALREDEEAFQLIPVPIRKLLLIQGLSYLNRHSSEASRSGLEILAARLTLVSSLKRPPQTIAGLKIAITDITAIRGAITSWHPEQSHKSDCPAKLPPIAEFISLQNACAHVVPCGVLETKYHKFLESWYRQLLADLLAYTRNHFLIPHHEQLSPYYWSIMPKLEALELIE